jgi:decaprenylphospho-beta-D-erythro-pentofuranosid-2-ulose 2-reductase
MSAGTVLVLGATSGIMRAVAHELARRGHDLVLTGRDRAETETLAADLRIRHGVRTRARVLDALAFETHAREIEGCIQDAEGELAGAVLGIGYLGDQARAQQDGVEARRIVDTNLTACISLLTLLANHLEAKGRGFLCVLSSVAGDRGRQSNYVYGAAKAGLSAYLSGLRNRLHHSGVQVTTVLPGFVDTAMTYGKEGMFLVAPPERIARGIVRAVDRRRDVVYLPGFWRGIMLVIRNIPEALFKRLRL